MKKDQLEDTGVNRMITLTVQDAVAQGRDQWWAPVNITMNLRAEQKEENFLTRLQSVMFSRRSMHNGALLKCIRHYVIIRSKMDQATTSMTCIAEVPGSNLDGNTDYASLSVQTNTGILPHIKSGRFLSHPFQFTILVSTLYHSY